MNDPIFMSDGEVDPISHQQLPPPRVPRDRVLAIGGAFWFSMAVGVFVYFAAYLAWQWIKS